MVVIVNSQLSYLTVSLKSLVHHHGVRMNGKSFSSEHSSLLGLEESVAEIRQGENAMKYSPVVVRV